MNYQHTSAVLVGDRRLAARRLKNNVQHQPARTYENEYGKEITSVEHRAGWDATFSAPKSVSLTALVRGDLRVREAHRESVRVALDELQRYTQARIGNIHAPETTGNFIAATFEHDTARPVDGYAAPQLQTHAVIWSAVRRRRSFCQSACVGSTIFWRLEGCHSGRSGAGF